MGVKVLFSVFVIFLSLVSVTGQVGIGTTAPEGGLEISNTTGGGLVLPMYHLSGDNDNTTVKNPNTGGVPKDGTLIFNTATVTGSNAISKGIVSWNASNSKWISLNANTGNGWGLVGNNLSTGNEFLGTSSNHDLIFKVNNNPIANFRKDYGVSIGQNSVANQQSFAIGQNSNASGNQSLALGATSYASGDRSMAMGSGAKATDLETTAIGRNSEASGFQSIAMGLEAKSSANETVALGFQSIASADRSMALGRSAQAISRNTVSMGYQAKATKEGAFASGFQAEANGQNSTAIGYQAKVFNDNSLVLGNNNVKVGIGTNSPQARLDVNGSFKLTNGSQGTGKVLTSDANGNATWATASSNNTSGWGLAGNTLSTGNEFLGTKSYHDLIFKVNNSTIANFRKDKGVSIGEGSTAIQQSFALGHGANAAGQQSTAIGYQSRSTQREALSLGYQSKAVGISSLAIGRSVEANSQNSIAIGYQAKSNGQNSAAIGYQARSNGQNSTAIGYQATAATDNSIVLGNNNINVGIGTNSPQARLDVNGSFKLSNGSQGSGKVLTSDANGNATWTKASEKVYGQKFSNSDVNGLNQYNAIVFGTAGPSEGVNMSGNNNIQTQAAVGVYKITYTLVLEQISAGSTHTEFYIEVDGNKINFSESYGNMTAAGQKITITKSMLHDITNTYRQVKLFSSTNDTNVKILKGSSLMVELVD